MSEGRVRLRASKQESRGIPWDIRNVPIAPSMRIMFFILANFNVLDVVNLLPEEQLPKTPKTIRGIRDAIIARRRAVFGGHEILRGEHLGHRFGRLLR